MAAVLIVFSTAAGAACLTIGPTVLLPGQGLRPGSELAYCDTIEPGYLAIPSAVPHVAILNPVMLVGMCVFALAGGWFWLAEARMRGAASHAGHASAVAIMLVLVFCAGQSVGPYNHRHLFGEAWCWWGVALIPIVVHLASTCDPATRLPMRFTTIPLAVMAGVGAFTFGVTGQGWLFLNDFNHQFPDSWSPWPPYPTWTRVLRIVAWAASLPLLVSLAILPKSRRVILTLFALAAFVWCVVVSCSFVGFCRFTADTTRGWPAVSPAEMTVRLGEALLVLPIAVHLAAWSLTRQPRRAQFARAIRTRLAPTPPVVS